MLIKVSILLILIFSYFLDSKGKTDVDIDQLFINWNKATIASLRQQSKTNESTAKGYYKNRLEAFYAYIDIETDSQLNKSSIRYRFLEYIKKQLQTEEAFIIEANSSGGRVILQNFVLYPKSTDKVDLEIYRCNLRGWRKDTLIKNYSISADSTLLHGRVAWANGFNYDDVIISHINKGKVKGSEFFLFHTLSNEKVKKVFQSDNIPIYNSRMKKSG